MSTKKINPRRLLITATAAKLFREKGYSATGMREIATIVGIVATINGTIDIINGIIASIDGIIATIDCIIVTIDCIGADPGLFWG